MYAKEGWCDSEYDISQNRGHGRPFGDGRSYEDRSRMPDRDHGKERQINYEGENTSFVRNDGLCFVCQRSGHFARECPKTDRDTLGAAAVVQASFRISAIRGGVR